MTLADLKFWEEGAGIGRAKFFVWGLLLAIVKFNFDRYLLFGFRQNPEWDIYLAPGSVFGPLSHAKGHPELFTAMLAVTLPFVIAGCWLTVARLRNAALPLGLVLLFFIPFLNYMFFLLLCLAPSRKAAIHPESAVHSQLGRMIPSTTTGAAIAGALAAAVLTTIFIVLGTKVFQNYGWGLFLGLPFLQGLVVSLVLNFHQVRGRKSTYGTTLLSLFLTAGLMTGFLLEGVVCIVMALPIALPLAMLGAWIGGGIQQLHHGRGASPVIAGALLLAFPGMMGLENIARPPVDSFSVTSEIVVNAPPETVWKNVVGFSELSPPVEPLFKTGVAYPTHATIVGSGVGAVRYCHFTTGAFVEPIQVWNEPNELGFGVAEQPPVMRELSWKRDFMPAHVSDNYLRSTRGRFLLERLPGGRTRLIGTTWYTLRFWPSTYWSVWSDAIIHRIHMRVLEHVKRLSEANH